MIKVGLPFQKGDEKLAASLYGEMVAGKNRKGLTAKAARLPVEVIDEWHQSTTGESLLGAAVSFRCPAVVDALLERAGLSF